MTFRTLRQFKLIQDSLELVVTPNRFGQSIYDDGECEEVLISEFPHLYGICIPPKKYSSDDCRIIYQPSNDLLQPLRIWQNTDYDFALTVPLTRKQFLAEAKDSGNPVYPFKSQELAGFLSFNSPFACKETSSAYILTGRFNFKEFSGLAYLDIETSRTGMSLAIEVLTSKLTYESDFVFLVEELSRLHSEIILNLDAPVSVGMGFDSVHEVSPHALLIHLRRLFNDDQLPAAIATILNNPHSRFKTVVQREHAAFVTKPCLTSLATNPFVHNWIKDGPLHDNFCGYTPQTLPSRETKLHHNTVENQVVKAFLQRLSYILQDLVDVLPLKYTTSHANLAKWNNQVAQWKSNPFWDSVSDVTQVPNSMVLMGRQGYREFYFCSLCFDLALKFEKKSPHSRDGQLKPVWALYQIWCYFQLYMILEIIAKSPSSPGLESVFNLDLFNLSIKEGINSAVEFQFQNALQRDVKIKLYCNRTFTRTKLKEEWAEVYSGFYHPDFSIEIIYNGRAHWLHFDAKYKLDTKQWQNELTTNDTGKGNAKVEHPNLDKVHSYRDAILGTRGSYILFPDHRHNPVVFVRHANSAYRDNVPGPSIGAFPLRPSRNECSLISQRDNIQKRIEAFLDEIYSSANYTEEEGFS